MSQGSKSQVMLKFQSLIEICIVMMFQCMVSVMDWRLKEEENETYEGDIVYSE